MSERASPYGNDARARLTRQGQITVPKAIREALGASAGDELVFERRGEEVLVRHVPRGSLSSWAGAASATAVHWSGTDEELERIVSQEVAGAEPSTRTRRRARPRSTDG
jgi:AbrB family looped-hinge helix DNA binding protein